MVCANRNQDMNPATIYTVATGDYIYGAFALINSLRTLGVTNPVVVGTDKDWPELADLGGVQQVVFDSGWSGLNLKSVLILENPADEFIFFDADIIVTH